MKNKLWNKVLVIPALVMEIHDNEVVCECLIEADIFESRIFPKEVFSDSLLIIRKPVKITISTKIGTIKMNIQDGENFVDMKLFQIDEQAWKDLEEYFTKVKPIKNYFK